jgi:hypothetical protein
MGRDPRLYVSIFALVGVVGAVRYARQKKGGETVSEKRIAHDFAWAAAFDVIDGLRPVLRDEEVHDCFEMIYERFKSAIEAAFDTRSRELHRLNPSKN